MHYLLCRFFHTMSILHILHALPGVLVFNLGFDNNILHILHASSPLLNFHKKTIFHVLYALPPLLIFRGGSLSRSGHDTQSDSQSVRNTFEVDLKVIVILYVRFAIQYPKVIKIMYYL